jgi:hypothetical protein
MAAFSATNFLLGDLEEDEARASLAAPLEGY